MLMIPIQLDPEPLPFKYITETCPCNIERFFTAVKMKKKLIKKDNFLIFAQNIDCGYSVRRF